MCVFVLKTNSFLKEVLGRQTIVLTGGISLCLTYWVLIKGTVVDEGKYCCDVLLAEVLG